MRREIILAGASLAFILVLVNVMEYRLLVLDHSMEAYILAIAVTFTAVGGWAGWKLTSTARALPIPLTDAVAADREGITPRELEVLALVALGLSNQEIGERLFVSLNTVKSHLSSVYQKLGVRRRTQAVQRAKAIGLIA